MKNFVLILLLLITSFPAFSQFGIKGGINVSNITSKNDNIEDLKSKLGFQAGAMLRINLGDALAVQGEALFTRKGSKYKFFGADVTSNLDYLDIPVLLVLKPFNAGLQFHVGPQFSYLLATSVTYENALFGSQTTYKADREDFEDYDLGLAAGIGLGLEKTYIELRYTQGLKKFEKDSSVGTIEIQPSSKHFNLQASVGVFF